MLKTFLPVRGDPEFLGDLKEAVGKEGEPSTSFKGPWSGVKEMAKHFRVFENKRDFLSCLWLKKTNKPSSLD